MATKYDEQNVHAQGRFDNRFAAGLQYLYAKEIDRRYGRGTADKILVRSRMTKKIDKFEIDHLTIYYKKEADKLRKLKNL